MLTLLTIAAVAVTGSELPEPEYVLHRPGLAFEVLPEELVPPVEGTLTEEAGVITSGPNATGIEYRLYYWKENLEQNSRKDEWLTERFRDIISPDILPSLRMGEVNWMEGSTGSSRWESSSIGLVPAVTFNMINSSGAVMGRGRACAIFPGEYSVLLYGIAPYAADMDIVEALDEMVAGIYMYGE